MSFHCSVPDAVADMLASDIPPCDVLACCPVDMDSQCRYVDGWLVLTADRLMWICRPHGAKDKLFGGVFIKEDPRQKPSDVPATKVVYLLDRCGDASVEPLVSGGMLVLPVDGIDTVVCAFTCAHNAAVLRLVGLINKLRREEILSEEDVQIDKEDAFCPVCKAAYPEKERKVCPKCMDKRSVFMRMLGYFSPYAPRIALMMLCFLLISAIGTALPYLTGHVLYDNLLSRNEAFRQALGLPVVQFATLLGLVVLVMVVMKTTGQLLEIVQGMIVSRLVPNVVYTIKSDVFNALRRLSLNFFTSRQTGSLMTRVLNDADEVTGFFIDILPLFVGHLITLLIAVAVMFALHWQLALISVFLLPFLVVISLRLHPRLWHFFGKRHRASRNMNAHLSDSIIGARVIKAFGQESTATSHFQKKSTKVREADVSIVGMSNRFYILYIGTQNAMNLLVWLFASLFILDKSGSLTFGMLATFAGYMAMLSGPLDFMSNAFRWWANSMNAAQRIFEIVDAIPDLEEKESSIDIGCARGDVELSHVSFGYEKSLPVLTDISLTAQAGQMLGVVGRSGAGKSTLVNLILRMYDPLDGVITLDGINIKDITLASLRKNIAMVSQETYIFMGTVAENIAYSHPQATNQDIVFAAVSASAHDFICKTPDGYDTLVGSAGRQLSGGERQRLSIARAILANPRILILDEATSSVDTETERSIQRSLDRLIQGRTIISIAHRLSTLKNADALVVLDDGKIVESGTHQQLMAQKGTYYKLVKLQSKALAMKGADSHMDQEKQVAPTNQTHDFDILEQERHTANEQLVLRFIDDSNAVFVRTNGGFLSLDYKGMHYDRVSIYRAFPFSAPTEYLSIRESTTKQREIGMIRDMKTLSCQTREMLEEQLALRYFTPIITRIDNIKDEYGYSYWDTQTDRGTCRFTIRNNSIAKLSATRLLLSDIDGNRFEIPDITRLTARELKLIDLYI